MAVPTPESYRYVVNVIGGCSWYKALVPVQKKGHAKTALMHVFNASEKKTEQKVEIIWTADDK